MNVLANRDTLRALQVIPNVGPAMAADLLRLEVRSPEDLIGRDPDAMYEALCAHDGVHHDPCVRDVFAAAIAYAETGERTPWWHFSRDRKARDRN